MKPCPAHDHYSDACQFCVAIRDAVAEERERCAALADMQGVYLVSLQGGSGPEIEQRENHTATLIARQIRAGMVV